MEARGIRVGRAEPASDGAVVRAVLAGDVEQFAVLVRRYRDRYARYAAHMLGSADAAEDAIQDALIRAFDQLKQCREPDRFAGWFFLILRNRCFAERRRGFREARPLEDSREVATSLDGPDGAVERIQRRRPPEPALLVLTPEQREVVGLKHVEGLPYEAIAQLT